MNDNERAYGLDEQKTERFRIGASFCSFLVSKAFVLLLVYIIFEGLVRLTTGRGATDLSALAKLVTAFHLDRLFLCAWAILASCFWYKERKGRKRAIKKKSEYQHLFESTEPNRTSSGLTPVGDTPRYQQGVQP